MKKQKYKLRFFKVEMHPDSYEREVIEHDIFIFYSMCVRYTVTRIGQTNKFSLTMIFNDSTFIQVLKAGYPLYTRLIGEKNFERALKKQQNVYTKC